MNSSRKLKRNKLRKVVGNRGLQSAWKKEKVENLLDRRETVVKDRKKAMKKKAMAKNPEEKRRLSLEKLDIDKRLSKLGYSFKYKKLMG